jgi:hypothetical protein
MKKTFLYCFFLYLMCQSAPAWAESLNLISYYPAPTSSYKGLRLKPQTALPTGNCNLGTIYANSSDRSLPYFCGEAPLTGLPTFSTISGAWTLNSDDLYLTDTSVPLNKKVGIGTTTPQFKLTLTNDGGILADNVTGSSSALPVSGVGTRLIWYPKKGAFRAGYVTDYEWNDANVGQYSMAMGYGNTASSNGASIWGGQSNSAIDSQLSSSPVISGGKSNNTTAVLSQILGGESNTAGIGARVSGKSNTSNGNYSMIGGGEGNTAAGNYSTISGGKSNSADGTATTVSGGLQNKTPSDKTHLTISGGSGPALFIASSFNNYSTISGGLSNIVPGAYAVVGGGQLNRGTGDYSVSSGGYLNQALAPYSVVTGGFINAPSCAAGYCTVLGGSNNFASGNYATAMGGAGNVAAGNYSFVPGGESNTANADYSLAAGKNMITVTGPAARRTFVWGYSNIATSIATSDAMIIASGRMGIRDVGPAATLEIYDNNTVDDFINLTSTTVATPGDIFTIKSSGRVGVKNTSPLYPMHFGNGAYVATTGNFVDASSRVYKENITNLNVSAAMAAFSKLEPVKYNYKNEPDHQYLGFIAEDVPELVADKSHQGLAPMDIAAVLTKVISHQQDILQEQKKETEELLKEFAELKNKITVKNQHN